MLPSLEVLLVQSEVGCLVPILEFFDYAVPKQKNLKPWLEVFLVKRLVIYVCHQLDMARTIYENDSASITSPSFLVIITVADRGVLPPLTAPQALPGC